MTLVPLRYVQRYRSRGQVYAYYRRDGKRARLPGLYGTPEFLVSYQAAHAAAEAAHRAPAERAATVAGSFQALADLYRASPAYRRMQPKTRADYDRFLDALLKKFGQHPVRLMPRAWVLDRQAELQDRPRTANYMLAVLRRVLAFAVEREWRGDNPAASVRALPYRRNPHRAWTRVEIAAFTGPDAPAEIRRAVLLALYTGQREGDVLRLLWSAYLGGVFRLRQSKTGAELTIPAHPELRREMDGAPRTAAVICTTPDGGAWKADHFRHCFAQARADLGLDASATFHGLRHSAASRLAEAGCSTAEIAAITGHRTVAMVEHYSRGAKQEKLARSAIKKLGKGAAGV